MRLYTALLSGLDGNREFPDPWGEICAGSGLNCAKAEPSFKSEVFFQSHGVDGHQNLYSFFKGLFCCPHLVGQSLVAVVV